MLIYFLGCLVSLGVSLGILKYLEEKLLVRDLGLLAALTLFSWIGALVLACLVGSCVLDKYGDKEVF